jgi:serine protease Do
MKCKNDSVVPRKKKNDLIRIIETYPALPLMLFVTVFFLSSSTLRAEPRQPGKHIPIGSSKKPELPSPGPMGSIFSAIAAKVVPAVVSVIPTKLEAHQQRVAALGSGVIISSEGLILSNYHVIRDAKEIEVLLSDHRNFPAAVVGLDSLTDVAVIRIKDSVSDLPAAYLGNSDSLLPGDWVMAIGNPFALTSTVTVGVVSAVNRQVESPNKYENFIQTDAAVNPGNSGGALVNIKGELIGINTMILSESGGFMGIGFAVPINMARHDIEDIITSGKVIRGWIGASIQDLSPVSREALGAPKENGALIPGVMKGQPADQAGVRAGDVIVSIDNKPVRDGNDLRNKVAEISPGTTVPASIIRQGKELKLSITVLEQTPQRIAEAETGRRPAPLPRVKATEVFGIETVTLTPNLRKKMALPAGAGGIAVASVNSSIMDERMLLKPDDVIERIKIDGGDFQEVAGVEQFKADAAKAKKGDPVLLLVARGGDTFFISFKVR